MSRFFISCTLLGGLLLILVPSSPLKAQTGLMPAEGGATSVEERRIQSAIQQEVARLQQKEEMLQMREMELKTLSREVDSKLAELDKQRGELTELLREKRRMENEKAVELSKIYERMDPRRAAMLLVTLEKELAVAIIEGMNSKRAGRILDSMDPDIAASLSQSYARLDRR